jgi:6-phosphofructo-2-kinase/fructose-2,6-biphosphatase 2
MNYIEDSGINVPVIHLESICDDENIIMRNIITNKLGNPDYVKVQREEAIRDFFERIAQY